MFLSRNNLVRGHHSRVKCCGSCGEERIVVRGGGGSPALPRAGCPPPQRDVPVSYPSVKHSTNCSFSHPEKSDVALSLARADNHQSADRSDLFTWSTVNNLEWTTKDTRKK
ncbi:hypothetical protein Bbelb_245960 [Branchiostoma belcheri]|nr:hypothetical protein Bbelb_245960 [Branchiostoma belcheri]